MRRTNNKMNNIEALYTQWLDRLDSGDRSITMIRDAKDRMILVKDGIENAATIEELRIMSDYGDVVLSASYTSADKPLKYADVLIDENKNMIVNFADKGMRYLGEPFEGYDPEDNAIKNVIIYCKTAAVHTFIFASDAHPKVQMVEIPVESQNDAVFNCMEALVPCYSESEKEMMALLRLDRQKENMGE